ALAGPQEVQLQSVRFCGERLDRLRRRRGMGHATQRSADEAAEQTAIQRDGPDGSHGQSPSDEAPALTMTRDAAALKWARTSRSLPCCWFDSGQRFGAEVSRALRSGLDVFHQPEEPLGERGVDVN